MYGYVPQKLGGGGICIVFKAVASPAKLFPKLKHITLRSLRCCLVFWLNFLFADILSSYWCSVVLENICILNYT